MTAQPFSKCKEKKANESENVEFSAIEIANDITFNQIHEDQVFLGSVNLWFAHRWTVHT